MVKTEASHAFNIGSNPVRVTTSSQAAYHSRWRKRHLSFIPLRLLSTRKHYAGLLAVGGTVQNEPATLGFILVNEGFPFAASYPLASFAYCEIKRDANRPIALGFIFVSGVIPLPCCYFFSFERGSSATVQSTSEKKFCNTASKKVLDKSAKSW